ncbi:MAG: hypothetical protein JST31_06540 [Actinobacteria bacterium]|nr:hypothetical protein [Actinomycetota bacterium]
MPAPSGFRYEIEGATVAIYHRGRRATVLRGRDAERFLAVVAGADEQQLMARVTGNYRRGNERAGKRSPRSGNENRRRA